jgi:hypothetical protein
VSKSGRGDAPLTGDDLATELIPGNSAADGTGGSGCSEKAWWLANSPRYKQAFSTYLLHDLGLEVSKLTSTLGSALRRSEFVTLVNREVLVNRLTVQRTVSCTVRLRWCLRSRGPQTHERLSFRDLDDDSFTIPGGHLELLCHFRQLLNSIPLCSEHTHKILEFRNPGLHLEEFLDDGEVIIPDVLNSLLELHLCFVGEIRREDSRQCDLVLS